MALGGRASRRVSGAEEGLGLRDDLGVVTDGAPVDVGVAESPGHLAEVGHVDLALELLPGCAAGLRGVSHGVELDEDVAPGALVVEVEGVLAANHGLLLLLRIGGSELGHEQLQLRLRGGSGKKKWTSS